MVRLCAECLEEKDLKMGQHFVGEVERLKKIKYNKSSDNCFYLFHSRGIIRTRVEKNSSRVL